MSRLIAVLVLVMGLFASMAGMAAADHPVADGDGEFGDVSQMTHSAIAFGEVCVGATPSREVGITIRRGRDSDPAVDNQISFGNSAVVDVIAEPRHSALSNAPAPGSITLPANWSTVATGTQSGLATTTVSFAATAVGAVAGEMLFRLQGPNANGDSIRRSRFLDVTAEVVDCGSSTHKAGSAIPIKFNLGGDQGANPFLAGYPQHGTVPCGEAGPMSNVTTSDQPGARQLSVNANGDYQYVWKTPKTPGCYQLVMKFTNGQTIRRYFFLR